MAPWKDHVFEDWWPLGQAMILVRASIRRTARAMKAEGKRLFRLTNAEFDFEWLRRSSIDNLFDSVDRFTIMSSMRFALPTTGKWTVIWNNASRCDGHSSFAHCLAAIQKLETIHFYSSDQNSTQLAGTHFSHYAPVRGEDAVLRDVYCCNQGSRWHFQQIGEPLPEEDVARYSAARKRDRLNEESLMELLERFGVHPWRERTYNFRKRCFCMMDASETPAGACVTFPQIRARASGKTPAEDTELHGPPDYLLGVCVTPDPEGPARLLRDGSWRVYGHEVYWVYDIRKAANVFSVRLPTPEGPPVVEAELTDGSSAFAIYDARRHPASPFCVSTEEPRFQAIHRCPKCDSAIFRIAVGFEVPASAETPNDTTWFALSVQCQACGFAQIAYEDETA